MVKVSIFKSIFNSILHNKTRMFWLLATYSQHSHSGPRVGFYKNLCLVMEDTFYCFINLDKVSFQLLQELSVKKFFLEEDGTIEEIDGRKENLEF